MTLPSERDLLNAWRILGIGGGEAGFELSSLPIESSLRGRLARIARHANGQPALLIPFSREGATRSFNTGRVLRADFVTYEFAGSSSDFIQVTCTDRRFDSVFISFVADVVRRLDEGKAPIVAVENSISEFRELFQRSKDVSLQEVVGLFGELCVLRQMLSLRKGAVDSWTGPIDQLHDFSSKSACAEVKTTLRGSGSFIFISGIDQLEPPIDGRPLFLIRALLGDAGAGGKCTIELLDECIAESSARFEIDDRVSRLLGDGFRENELLLGRRFLLNSLDVYAIGAGFPRLSTNAFLPGQPIPGVQDITYTLDLGYAREFLVPLAERGAFWKVLAGAP
jgi:hypothetical protein